MNNQMIDDQIILDMHRETKEQTKMLYELKSSLSTHISTNEARLEVVDQHIEVQQKNWKMNKALWILLLTAICTAGAWYYNIPFLKGASSFVGVVVGGWTVKEMIS